MRSLFRCGSLALSLTLLAGSCNLFDDLSTPVGYCIAQVKQFCRAQFACCTDTERTQVFAIFIIASGDPYSNEGECVDSYTQVCEAYGASANEAVRENRMTLDADKAAECVEGMKAGVDACDPEAILTRDPVCDEALAGAVGEGDDCFNDNECEDEGSVCQREPNEVQGDTVTVTLVGSCKALLPDGAECTLDEECQGQFCAGVDEGECSNNGFFCEFDDECFEDFCFADVCDLSGDPCTIDDDCNVGAICEVSATGTCEGGGEGEGEGEGEEPTLEFEFCNGLD